MGFTSNKFELPAEICSALSRDRYKAGSPELSNFSVTELIAPIQQTILKRRYPDLPSGDVVDNLWSMFGSIAHSLLEEHGSEDSLVEERFYAEVLGKKISGGIDHIKNGIITDYKVTACWKIQKGNFKEWTEQLNSYCFLCEENGATIDSIRIIAILRDWSAPDGYKPDYPKAPIVIIDIPKWQSCEQAAFIWSRVAALKNNELLEDDKLQECTNEEMWASEPKWACMKKDAKRATRVFDKESTAYDFCLDNNLQLIERKGERRRCNKYCQASSVCCQHKAYLKERGYDGEL